MKKRIIDGIEVQRSSGNVYETFLKALDEVFHLQSNAPCPAHTQKLIGTPLAARPFGTPG
jgi:hypothetical protein